MNQPLRVLLVSEPGIDGVFRHVEALTYYCLARGVKVHLAYSDLRSGEGLKTLVQAVRESGGETLNLRIGNAPAPSDLGALLKIRALAKRVGADVVHGHSSKGGALARMLRWTGWRGPIFYSPQAYYGMAPRPSRLKTAFYNSLERILAPFGITINISQDEASFGRDTLGVREENRRIIHNTVNTESFVPADAVARRKRREELGLPLDRLILGFIGRSSFQKDPQGLYRAVAPVLAAHPELLLFHVGQGEFDAELVELAKSLGIADRIVRRPYLEAPACFYEAIDALIVPSRYEAGWPLVTLEALACNLPIISSVAPGTSDIAQGGLSHCWTAPAEDVPGFTRGIEAWLADRPAGRPCNHRETAINRFGLDKCLGAVLAEYKKSVA
jgi:glycosyltransferase involved in cell wall biosynthesis